MPFRSSRLPCVSCDSARLSDETRSGISYQSCTTCEGVWIKEPEFQALMEQVQPGGDHSVLVHNDGSERRSCPLCKERMEIAWILFLQLDRCEEHGLWFDTGELERALKDEVGREVLKKVNRRVTERKKAEAKQKPNHAAALSGLLSFFRSK